MSNSDAIGIPVGARDRKRPTTMRKYVTSTSRQMAQLALLKVQIFSRILSATTSRGAAILMKEHVSNLCSTLFTKPDENMGQKTGTYLRRLNDGAEYRFS
jgi:hypothetical protein